MPTKRQNAPALSRHARSTSGGAGKAGLNLQFTQKDPPTTKLQDKMKKNGYGNEVGYRDADIVFLRLRGISVVSSKETLRFRELPVAFELVL